MSDDIRSVSDNGTQTRDQEPSALRLASNAVVRTKTDPHASSLHNGAHGTMATIHAVDEADIRRQVSTLVEAVRAMDLERVMFIYAPDIVSFDIIPPLQHMGAQSKRNNWADVFSTYQRPLGYEIRNLTISVDGEVAFGHSLNRITGTLKNGHTTDFWLRWTVGFRKIDGTWRIAHDHVSVPLDLETGGALLNLAP